MLPHPSDFPALNALLNSLPLKFCFSSSCSKGALMLHNNGQISFVVIVSCCFVTGHETPPKDLQLGLVHWLGKSTAFSKVYATGDLGVRYTFEFKCHESAMQVLIERHHICVCIVQRRSNLKAYQLHTQPITKIYVLARFVVPTIIQRIKSKICTMWKALYSAALCLHLISMTLNAGYLRN